MNPEELQYLLDTMRALHRARKMFATDVDFFVAVAAVVTLVNSSKESSEDDLLDEMKRIVARKSKK